MADDSGCAPVSGTSTVTYTCPLTDQIAYQCPKLGTSGCPSSKIEVSWHTCTENGSNKKVYFSCCRNQTAKEVCAAKEFSYDNVRIIHPAILYISGEEDKCSGTGSILVSDTTGVCCDFGFNNGEEITREDAYQIVTDFSAYCSSLSRNGFVSYTEKGQVGDSNFKCSKDGYNIAAYVTTASTHVGYDKLLCCQSKTIVQNVDEACSDSSSVLHSNGFASGTWINTKYITTTQDSAGNFICDEWYEIIAQNDQSACCSLLASEYENNEEKEESFSLNINTNHLKFQSLLDMNPLQNSSVFSDPDSRTPGNIINQALTAVVFPIAGVGLIILILWGGFQVLSGSLSGKQNNIDLGKKRVTAAVVGFILLFLIYWIWRLIALATGLSV